MYVAWKMVNRSEHSKDVPNRQAADLLFSEQMKNDLVTEVQIHDDNDTILRREETGIPDLPMNHPYFMKYRYFD